MKDSTRRLLKIPTELRLLIWSFAVPKIVIICGRYQLSNPDTLELSPVINRGTFQLFPAIQTQLLLVNKQVYDEVLPLLQRIEVQTHMHVRDGFDWAGFERAWQSRAFGALHYCSRNDLSTDFLLYFITMQTPQLSRKLKLSLTEPFRRPFAFDRSPGRFHSKTYPYYGVTVLAGIMLSKSLVSEVQLQLDRVPLSQLSGWNPEELRSYLLGSSTAKAQARLLDSRTGMRYPENLHLYKEMRSREGPIPASRIQITTSILHTWEHDNDKWFTLQVRYSLTPRRSPRWVEWLRFVT